MAAPAGPGRQRGRWRAICTGTLGVAAILTGCAEIGIAPPTPPVSRTKMLETAQFRMVPASRSWIYAPDGLLTLERDIGAGKEQRIALRNDTAIRGDNIVIMRSRKPGLLRAGRFDLQGFLDQVGGVPYPFETLSNRNMQTATDDMGSYFYAQKSMGPDVTCVLAIRSLGSDSRLLPNSADAVDIMLRNCTTKGRGAAIAPIQAARLGRVPGVTPEQERITLHSLSPFAAPKSAAGR